ncbi:MAG: 16S rRNA (adenine(1518)-N(6)/adenine(1519)-N(6))-dimethyltransferase RsmA [Microthrixaceae bacterium]|nr:16S rRNA (adenine(1518)-N(6)/adenine(1519)-N(6))-dimethyltransferase RsmA [Microthrixaceae bacterium]
MTEPRPGSTLPLLTRTRLLEVMAEHDLAPHRTLGQNFVIDHNTIRKIVRLAGVQPDDVVVEVGPGLGSLTLGLLEAGASVRAVEIDARLVPAMQAITAGAAEVTVADALEVDWSKVTRGEPCTLVANLPYNVATPVVLRILDEAPEIGRLVVMVQKEVAERLAATPGSKAYGIPSVKVAYWATARMVGTIGSEVFHPRPKVTSALVEIIRRPQPVDGSDPTALFPLVKAGFGQRRKTLRRSLSSLVDDEAFVAAGVSPSARAEELDVVAWCRLAAAVRNKAESALS